MEAKFTNTDGWTDVEGRIGRPSFPLQRIIWRGEGEDVYLVGTPGKKKIKDREAGLDYINWSEAPQWALDELEREGVTLPGRVKSDDDKKEEGSA